MEGGLEPDYVLDRMLMYELEPLLSSLHNRSKLDWEQARLIAYIVAQVNSSKKFKPSDIISFVWDEESSTGNTSISNEDILRLKVQTEKYKQTIYG